MKNRYALHIFWSDEDEAFVVVCQEFPGLSAFGETRVEALKQAQAALDLMIETYQKKESLCPNREPFCSKRLNRKPA